MVQISFSMVIDALYFMKTYPVHQVFRNSGLARVMLCTKQQELKFLLQQLENLLKCLP